MSIFSCNDKEVVAPTAQPIERSTPIEIMVSNRSDQNLPFVLFDAANLAWSSPRIENYGNDSSIAIQIVGGTCSYPQILAIVNSMHLTIARIDIEGLTSTTTIDNIVDLITHDHREFSCRTQRLVPMLNKFQQMIQCRTLELLFPLNGLTKIKSFINAGEQIIYRFYPNESRSSEGTKSYANPLTHGIPIPLSDVAFKGSYRVPATRIPLRVKIKSWINRIRKKKSTK